MGCGKQCECQITKTAFLRREYFICLVFLFLVFFLLADCYISDIGTRIPNVTLTKWLYFSLCAPGFCLYLEVCLVCKAHI